jgi:hypothetical protein
MKSLAKYMAVGAVLVVAAVTGHAQESASRPKYTSAEMSKRVEVLDRQIDDDAKLMTHLQAVARKEKDVVKLTCVNDVLVEAKAQRNLYDTNREQFTGAIEGDADTARPHYDALSDAAAAVKELRGHAEACIGVPELYKQESDVQVTHPDFPDDPTVDDPFIPETEAVAYASPYG